MSRILQCMYQLLLLFRSYPSKYGIAVCRIINFLIGIQCACIHIFLRMLDSGTSCHFGYGLRVITGNYFHCYTLSLKITKGLLRIFTNWIGKNHITQRLRFFGQGSLDITSRIFCQQKHTITFFRIFPNLICNFFKGISHDKFRRTQKIFSILKYNATVFCCRSKRHNLQCFPPGSHKGLYFRCFIFIAVGITISILIFALPLQIITNCFHSSIIIRHC